MSVKVRDMEWADMERLVTSRLNRLAMCKRGAVETDINGMKEALGHKPKWTKEELAAAKIKSSLEIQKAFKVSLADIKDNSLDELVSNVRTKISKIHSKYSRHPGVAKWESATKSLSKQREERLAQLDGDFQDASDMFRLGIKSLSEFPEECEKLESMVW